MMSDVARIKSAMVGSRAKQVRVEIGLTQSEVAEHLGFNSPSTLSHYETGLREMPLHVLFSLATYYGVMPEYILTGRNPEGKTFYDSAYQDGKRAAYQEFAEFLRENSQT